MSATDDLLAILEDDESFGEFCDSLKPVLPTPGCIVKTRFVYTGPISAREFPEDSSDQLSDKH